MTVQVIDNVNSHSVWFLKVKMILEHENQFVLMYANNRYTRVYERPNYSYEIIYKGGLKNGI